MKKLLMSLLALIMMSGTAMTVAAQDATPAADTGDAAETAFARTMGEPASYFNDRGKPVAVLTVTSVERGWEEYDEYSEPDPGIEYVALTMSVENVSNNNMIITPYDFTLLDSLGRNNSSSYVSVPDDVEIFEDDVAIASGETVEVTIIYSLYEDVDVSLVMWQPDSGIIVMSAVEE